MFVCFSNHSARQRWTRSTLIFGVGVLLAAGTACRDKENGQMKPSNDKPQHKTQAHDSDGGEPAPPVQGKELEPSGLEASDFESDVPLRSPMPELESIEDALPKEHESEQAEAEEGVSVPGKEPADSDPDPP